jgi:uncharacterized protein YdhG (YjbR/CyaY superfamily)
MTSTTSTIEQYINEAPEDRRAALQKIRTIILENLPEGFQEQISYGMIGYVVPHSIYPKGYHCTPELPLPFFSFASQKNSINFYHMGIYAKPELYDWFVSEYPKHSKQKLDIGKSCIRIKKPENIPFELIGELVKKMSVAEWIKTYEAAFNK